jgi:ankyrin repeat protein
MDFSLQKLFNVDDTTEKLKNVLSDIISNSEILFNIDESDIIYNLERLSLSINFNMLYMFYTGKYIDKNSYLNTVEKLLELIVYFVNLESDSLIHACMLLKIKDVEINKSSLVYEIATDVYEKIDLIKCDTFIDTIITNSIKYEYTQLITNNVNLLTQKHFDYICTIGTSDIIEYIVDKNTFNLNNGFLLACLNNHEEIASFLEDKASLTNDEIKMVLSKASEQNFFDIMELIISKYEEFINYVFLESIKNNNIDQLDFSLKENSEYFLNIGKLFIDMIEKNNLKVLNVLSKYYTDVIADKTLINLIIKNNNIDILNIFISNGYKKFETLLELSVKSNNLEFIEKALEYIKDELDFNLLIHASINSEVEIVRCLLKHKIDIHALNEKALREACINGNEEIVKMLLDHGANKHVLDDICFKNAESNNHHNIILLLDQ